MNAERKLLSNISTCLAIITLRSRLHPLLAPLEAELAELAA
jgi:hypothetical protein